jgi:hypothetical protein
MLTSNNLRFLLKIYANQKEDDEIEFHNVNFTISISQSENSSFAFIG